MAFSHALEQYVDDNHKSLHFVQRVSYKCIKMDSRYFMSIYDGQGHKITKLKS